MFGGIGNSLLDYIMQARPHTSRALGMTPPQDRAQPRIDQAFSAFPGAQNGPEMDFNQSFGAAPSNNPQDQQGFLNKYLQPQQQPPQPPGPPMDLAPGDPGGAGGYYGGSPETNPNLRPVGTPYPWHGMPGAGLLDTMSQMGGQPDAGLIPKFVNLLGRVGS